MQSEEAIQFALNKLQAELSPSLVYHDIRHTLEVMEESKALAELCGVSKTEQELLQIAAAFHDIGYLEIYDGHEAKSCEIVKNILPFYSFTEAQITRICELIMTTKMPQSPFDLESGILCDADLDYLGRDDYEEKAQSLRIELESIGIKYSDEEWLSVQINFLRNHAYHTEVERSRRDSGKRKVLKMLDPLSTNS
jgi:uncharacterized protein